MVEPAKIWSLIGRGSGAAAAIEAFAGGGSGLDEEVAGRRGQLRCSSGEESGVGRVGREWKGDVGKLTR